MASNGYPMARLPPNQQRPQPPGLAPMDDNDDAQDVEKGKDGKMPSAEVHEVVAPPEPVVVSWDGPDDKKNPQNFSSAKKWSITAVCCTLTINATFASSAPAIDGPRLIKQFGVSEEVSILVTTLFLLGYVFGPAIWGSGSELFGRRPIIIFAMCCYTVLFLGQALAKNFATLLITRFLSGLCAVAPLVTCGGIIADIWNAAGRGYAAALFGGSVFLGPSLGPLVGGFVVSSSLGWEWIFWVMMMFTGACTLHAYFFLPETFAPVLLASKAKRLRKADPIGNQHLTSDHEKQDNSFNGLMNRVIKRPWLIMASEPILMLITVYMSVVYGILYALFESFPIIFIEKRGFTASQLGMIFIGIGIGSILTAVMNIYFTRQVNKIIPKWKGFPPPEIRLLGAMVGAPMLVISSFWLGWTGNYDNVHWAAPAVASVFTGMGVSAIFVCFIIYIIDTYLMFAASALASNTMIRSLIGAIFPLFTVQMYHNLGVNWASTLIGLICLLLAPIPFLFYKYGAQIRTKSKFAPCIDLKIAKQIKEAEEAAARGSADTNATVGGKPTTTGPGALEAARAPSVHSVHNGEVPEVNEALLEHIHQLTTTVSEIQYLLNEAVSSQTATARSQRELVEAIRQLRNSFASGPRRESIISWSQDPTSPGGMPAVPEGAYYASRAPDPSQPMRAPAPTKLQSEWSVRLGPIDLTGVSDLHGIALSFARMTHRGNAISPQVRGRKGGPHILIISWKTEEEARAFYDAWSESPPDDYATLSVIPNF